MTVNVEKCNFLRVETYITLKKQCTMWKIWIKTVCCGIWWRLFTPLNTKTNKFISLKKRKRAKDFFEKHFYWIIFQIYLTIEKDEKIQEKQIKTQLMFMWLEKKCWTDSHYGEKKKETRKPPIARRQWTIS